MRHKQGKTTHNPGCPIALPLLAADEWAIVVETLALTPRQAQVVQLILQAKKDKQIAVEMGVDFWTVRTHLRRIFDRIGAADRVELVLHIFGVLRDARIRVPQ